MFKITAMQAPYMLTSMWILHACYIHAGLHRQTDTQRHTQRERDTHRGIHKERETHTQTYTERETHTDIHRQTERQTHTHTGIHRDTHYIQLTYHNFQYLLACHSWTSSKCSPLDTKSIATSTSLWPSLSPCIAHHLSCWFRLPCILTTSTPNHPQSHIFSASVLFSENISTC